MNRAPESWLLPTALVGYVALAAARDRGDSYSWLALIAPAFVAWGLRQSAQRQQSGRLATSVVGVRMAIVGLGLFAASALAPPDSSALRATAAIGQGLLTAAALLCVARLTPPPGLLAGHPAAESLDALWLSVVLWTTVTAATLLRAISPDSFPLDPIALDTALLFSSLGSLLLLCASFLRTRLLRGLELGVGDRIQAVLSLAIAGTIIGGGSGFVEMTSSDRVAGFTLVGTCTAVILALASPDAAAVTRAVRSLVALLLLGLPTALLGAWFALRFREQTAAVALAIAALGMLVGLIARSLARPLAPEGSRWLQAIVAAMDAALHPQPETALRGALSALRKAEPTSKARPELFRMDPPGMLSVDIAGYLTDDEVEFPEGVVDCALNEPHRTLRLESALSAQVRKPKVRPLVTWFEAHESKTATVLMDETGPVGLLSLPKGRRQSNLRMEEAELLGRLAERLAGLVSVTASLKRSRDRELIFQKQAKTASEKAEQLKNQLSEQHQSERLDAESRVAVLRAAAHGPAAQITRQELEDQAQGPSLMIQTPIGVDPVPWAAHAHLYRNSETRPLVVLDLSEDMHRSQAPWQLDSESSPWKRAKDGTLVLCYPSALPESSQLLLSDALDKYRPDFLVVCGAEFDRILPRLKRQFQGPVVQLPSLIERGEDIQALVISELARLGLVQRGTPYGIEKAALYKLIQGNYPGNDAELKGIVASAVGHTKGDIITLSDLELVSRDDESVRPPKATEKRSRSRPAPRSRRP